MKIRIKVALLFLGAIAAIAPAIDPARAHRFNVALVVPASNAGPAQGRQILDGFMLATAERDSHPDQVSDGHLGGLDVYVTVIDGTADRTKDIIDIVTRADIDIVAAFGSEPTLTLVGKLLDGAKVALLLPGQSPFSRPDLPAVAAFIAAYQARYGARPSRQAAQGYNAARRIDLAVRAQGGVDDTAALIRDFRQTTRGFAW